MSYNPFLKFLCLINHNQQNFLNIAKSLYTCFTKNSIYTLATDFPEMESASWQFIWSWFIHRWYHDINPTEVRKIYVHAGSDIAVELAANAPTGGLNKNADRLAKKLYGQGKESVVGSTECSLPKRSGHL